MCLCFSQTQCRRLWCTSPEGAQRGCRTQHMPWADGTDCSPGKVTIFELVERRKSPKSKPSTKVEQKSENRELMRVDEKREVYFSIYPGKGHTL